MNTIISYQRRLSAEYLDTIGYSATYLHGNPVLPVVPVQTKTESVMIIGAYPTRSSRPSAENAMCRWVTLPRPSQTRLTLIREWLDQSR